MIRNHFDTHAIRIGSRTNLQMEGENLGNSNGHLNTENGVQRKNHGRLEIGFSTAEMSSLKALCNVFFPSLPLEASGLLPVGSHYSKEVEKFYRASLSNGWGPYQVAETMKNVLKPEALKILKTILWLLSTSSGTFMLAGRQSLSTDFPFVQRFEDLPAEKRERILVDWSTSSFSFFRIIFQAFKGSLMWNHFTRVDDKGHNPFWKAIQYCGPDPVAITAQLSLKPLESSVLDVSTLHGDELVCALESRGCKISKASEIARLANVPCSSKDHGIECDVVIVGSGSGGGVAAAVLAKAGFKVVVLEKGGYRARHDLDLLEANSLRDLYDERGLLRTEDQNMFVLAGSTVGGGSAVNWAASFRTPDHVLREWDETLGLRLFGSFRYREAMDRVCERLGVQEGFENESFQNAVLRKGCEALGYHVANIPRNATADHYCGWCNFGCRKGIKQATSETWLVDAVNAGAVILSRCHAERVLHAPNGDNGLHSDGKARKALGVVARIGDTDRQLFIKARATIAASGALRTPPLLHTSGLKNPHIGKNLHLHPVQIVWGYFPPAVGPDGSCYQGGIMTAFSNEAGAWKTSGYGALIQTPILHPGIFASTMPWRSGSHFKETMLKFSRTSSLIVLLRDKGSGTVVVKPDRSLAVRYRIRTDDEERAREGVEKGLRVLAAAGAVEVGSHHQDMDSFKVGQGSDDELEEYVDRVAKKGGAPLYSAHQMGSCRMGVREAESAVDELCESWEVEGLFVGDGSVLPNALGINPMITIQSLAFCVAQNVVEYLKKNNSR